MAHDPQPSPGAPDRDGAPERDGARIGRRAFLSAAGLTGTAALLAACGRAAPQPAGSPVVTPGATPGPSPTPSPTPAPSSPAPATVGQVAARSRDNAITGENARHGDRHWNDLRVPGGVQAYLGIPSVGPGQPLALRASGTGKVDVEWYRLGWYGGAGGRLLRTDREVALRPQAVRAPDPVTGLVEAGWSSVLDTTAPTGVPSGMLLAALRARDGRLVANVPVVLRPDPSVDARAPVLFVSAAATWQAYNFWGGMDLYGDAAGLAVPSTHGRRAVKVSFDRPYREDAGAGYLRRWELQFIRWMERNGRDVEYVADIDLERNPGLVDGRRLVVMAGHPEYWSRPMRARIEAAVATGTSVAFLTANEVYWQVRFEAGATGPTTRLVCYKRAANDPMTAIDPTLATCQWREPPLSDPEATLVGQMYQAVVRRPSDWIVTRPEHWLYEGTGLAAGDALRNLVGQEFDTFFPDLAQPGTTVLARSPVFANPVTARHRGGDAGVAPVHTATIYTAASGATVLAAGTFQWSWAIDDFGARAYKGVRTPVDPRVARMTRNLFDRLGDGPLAP